MTAPISGAGRARRGRVARGAGGRSPGDVQGSSSVKAMTSTEVIETLTRQLPPLPQRPHHVRCPALVHEFPAGTLAAVITAAGWPVMIGRATCCRRRHCAAGAPQGTTADAAPAAPPAMLHTPEGRAVLLRAWEQLPTLWTGTRGTGNCLRPRRGRASAPSTMWTAACAIIQRPNDAREERLIKHGERRRETAIEPDGHRKLLMTRTSVSASDSRAVRGDGRWRSRPPTQQPTRQEKEVRNTDRRQRRTETKRGEK
jgi:hypothetical protein